LKDNAYGMTVRQEIEGRTGRSVSLGAVYATLDRLETKGYVVSRKGDASAVRQGRAKRYFRLESAGAGALRHSLRAIENMRAGIRSFKPQPGGIA
jgi:DNA-binding PadR family transcriptional regulator